GHRDPPDQRCARGARYVPRRCRAAHAGPVTQWPDRTATPARAMRHTQARLKPMTACRAPSFDRVAAHPKRVLVPRTARELAQEIQRGGEPDDELFDRFLPFRLRVMSRMFWTPLAVAARAAAWFAESGVVTVVDIGSGAGKFCVVA